MSIENPDEQNSGVAVSYGTEQLTNPDKLVLNKDNQYVFLNNAYYGEGGFKDCDYIVPHVREEQVRYNRRKMLGYYENYVKILVDASINPIWREEPTRTSNENKMWKEFVDDVDLKGSTFTMFMKKAGTFAKLHGVTFVLVENFEEAATNLSVALQERNLPYLVNITADRVTQWEIDKYGEIIKFGYTEPKGNLSNEEPILYTRVWTKDKWILLDENNDQIDEGENTLGFIPVVQYYGVNSNEFLPTSPFLQIAKINLRVFNQSSEMTEIESNQMYPLLVLPLTGNDSVTIGSGNGLGVDPDSSQSPKYISPQIDPLKIIKENKQDLIKNMFNLSGFSLNDGVNNLSAESKKWDFERTEKMLKEFSINSEGVENIIGYIFGKWIGEDVGFVSEYSPKFGISDLTDELSRLVDVVNEVNFGPVGNAEMKKKYARQEFANSTDEVLKDVEDSIDAQAEKDVVTEKEDLEGLNTIDEQ